MQALKTGCAIALLLITAPAFGQSAPPRFGFGTPATEAQIKGWDIDVRPDGTGLPPGKGSVTQGQKLYEQHCLACHGERGQNGAPGFDRLAGGIGTLNIAKPIRTVGSFWPYATTLYDYVNRAMPFPTPQTLTPDEVYAVVAYVLFVNNIVSEDAVMDARTLPKVKMPNADGFLPDPRPDTKNTQCMDQCK